MGIGIYKISWPSGEYYIGQSTDLKTRFSEHLSDLRLGKHFNYKLQETYSKLGTPNYTVLCEVPVASLDSVEESYIDLSNPLCLNILKGGSVNRGMDSPRCKYHDEDILEAFRLLCTRSLTHTEISKITGVDTSTVSDISSGRGRGCEWLQEKYPDMYAILLATKAKNTRGSREVTLSNGEATVVLKVGEFSEFCRKYGIQNANLSKVINGSRKSTQGWKLVNVNIIQ